MSDFDYELSSSICSYDFESNAINNAYNKLCLCLAAVFFLQALTKLCEYSNQLDYDSPKARTIAGFLRLMALAIHSDGKAIDFKEAHDNGRLIAVVPHRAGILEGVVVASKLKGRPPRFFATDMFDFIPGIASTMRMFKTIPIAVNTNKKDNKSKGNSGAIELGVEALENDETIIVFPQGGFSRINQEPLRVFIGVAKMAIKANKPVDVIRLDGIWALMNYLIPVSVRNNTYYRAMFSFFHLNKMSTRTPLVIDFHLKAQSQCMSEEDKVNEICAQLYAYGRHTEELTDEQLEVIENEVAEGLHQSIWQKKTQLCDRRRAFEKLTKNMPELSGALKIEQEMINKLKIEQDEREEVIFASPLRLCC